MMPRIPRFLSIRGIFNGHLKCIMKISVLIVKL